MLLVAALKRSQIGPLRSFVRSITSAAPHRLSTRSQICRRLASTSGAAAPKQPGVGGAAPGPKYKYPAELQLFHAGVSRITFLACVKLSTILSFAFFTFVVTPRYYEKEGWSPTTIRVALSGVVPLLFVAWTTSPFVLLVSTRLPPFARTSEQYLKRYLSRLPPDAILDITTMSPIAKPRASTVRLSELRPTNRRLGIVNYMRDTSAENATRKWYRFRAVGNFNIQANKTKGPLWLWESVANCISKNKS